MDMNRTIIDADRGHYFADFHSYGGGGQPMPIMSYSMQTAPNFCQAPLQTTPAAPIQQGGMAPVILFQGRSKIREMPPQFIPTVTQMQSAPMVPPQMQNTPIVLPQMQNTPTEIQGVPLNREPTFIVKDQTSSIIEIPLAPRFRFEGNKIENSSTLPLIIPIGVRERKDDPIKFDRFGRPKLDIDAYVKYLLGENEMDPGVNILSYNDPEGGKHKASLLPKGAIQADVAGGPVYQRMHFWIKDINGMSRRSKQTMIKNEMKRIEYMNVPLGRFIHEYEKNHFEYRQHISLIQNEDELIVAENENTSDSRQNSYVDDNNESESDNVNPPVLVEQSVNQSKLIPMFAEKPRLIEKLVALQKASVPDERKAEKKEIDLKLLKRLNSGKSKTRGGRKLRK